MLGYNSVEQKFDQTFLLPLKVLLGSWVQWWMAQSRAHASLLVGNVPPFSKLGCPGHPLSICKAREEKATGHETMLFICNEAL